MIKFFEMVVAFLGSIIAFFDKFRIFGNSSSMLSNVRLIGRKTLYVILIPLMIAYIVLLIAFFYYMIDSLITAYNLISALLVKIQTMQTGSGSTSPILQPLFLLLNSTGFATGFNAAFPFIASALTFRLLSPLYKLTLRIHDRILDIGQKIADGITAA